MQQNWRKSLQCVCILLLATWLNGCEAKQLQASELHLAVVNTPKDSGLLDYLLMDFEAQTGIHVNIHSSSDPFAIGLVGEADIIISHYGKAGMTEFVSGGHGSWPKMVFSNQAVLIGPSDDPAEVSQSTSLSDAFKSIVSNEQQLIANNIGGIVELTELASRISEQDLKAEWYQDLGVSKGKAIKTADQGQAYVLWGAVPFLKFQQKHHSGLKILFSADPILHRVMAITRVSAKSSQNVNTKGAKQLENYLLSSEVQAKVMRFRMTGSDHQLWWPAARDN